MTEALIALGGFALLVLVAFFWGRSSEKGKVSEKAAQITRRQVRAAIKVPRTKKVLERLWIAASFSLLVGCATTSVCPPIQEYTEAEQRQASEELGELPDESMLVRFIVDYGQLRAMLMECQ